MRHGSMVKKPFPKPSGVQSPSQPAVPWATPLRAGSRRKAPQGGGVDRAIGFQTLILVVLPPEALVPTMATISISAPSSSRSSSARNSTRACSNC